MKRLGQWVGPVIIVNTNRFYDRLLEFLEHSVSERFMGRSHLKMWSVVDDPEQVLEAIANADEWNSDALEYANVTSANA